MRLCSLHNVLHYGFALRNVRRGMRIAEASVRLADRLGAVQSSIELRVLLAFYHLDRNEVWSAAQVLGEAQRRAAAIGNRHSLLTIAILEGHTLLKQGRIADGLDAIAAAVAGVPHVAFLSLPVEEARRYLQTIGVPQPGLFVVNLARERVAEFAAAIEETATQAKASGTIPWEGMHCSVSNSSAIDENDLRILFRIGVHEFERDRANAANLGLMLAKILLNHGFFDDAARAASNTQANPEATETQRGEAHMCLAHADAARGYLEQVDAHLDAAVESFDRAGHPPPSTLAIVGLWYAVQCDDVAAATRWAKLLGETIADHDVADRYPIATDVFYRLASFGPSMSAVMDAFTHACEDAGIRLPTAPTTPPPVPHRYFDGANADLGNQSVESANDVIAKALDALRAGETERARELVDSQTGELPDHQAAVLLAMQLRIVARDMPPEALDRAMDTERSRLVPELAFASLARLEHTVASMAIENQQPELAANILDTRGFIAELASDLRARVQLSALATESDRLRGKRKDAGAHALWSRREAHYFGLPALEWAAPAVDGGEEQFILTMLKLRAELSKSNDAVIRSARELRSKRLLTPYRLAVLRGEWANWLLNAKEFDAAARLYRKAAHGFHRSNNLDDELNAMAGEARVLSRSGRYADAVARFEDAIKKAEKRRLLPNLLLGLGAAHLLEGSERRDPIDGALVDAAIATYRRAIDLAPLESMERALARLGLARALGEKNDRAGALEEFDRACAELAHLGSPNAKTLIENRRFFEQGDWHRLGLF
jgi:tetratricopeptide (TPR) repeat protein